MPRFPRLSLTTLFLLATIVCLSVAFWSTTRQLRRQLRTLQRDLGDASNEIQQYRDELGHLAILDEAKLHVIRMPLHGEMQWQWRIHVPEADRFAIAVGTGMIPKEGFVSYGGSLPLPAGETIVRASVFRDDRGRLVFRVGRPIGGFKTELKGELAERLKPGYDSSVAGSGGTEVANPGEPFALLRFRALEETQLTNADGTVSSGWRTPKGSTMGLMAWITDSKPSNKKSLTAPRTKTLP